MTDDDMVWSSGLPLDAVLHPCRKARDGKWGVLTTTEKLTVALVINRPDCIAELGFTLAQAIERVGMEQVAVMPTAVQRLAAESPLNYVLDDRAIHPNYKPVNWGFDDE